VARKRIGLTGGKARGADRERENIHSCSSSGSSSSSAVPAHVGKYNGLVAGLCRQNHARTLFTPAQEDERQIGREGGREWYAANGPWLGNRPPPTGPPKGARRAGPTRWGCGRR